VIQTVAYLGKLVVHPQAAQSLEEMFARGDVGPIPGEVMIGMGLLYVCTWAGTAIWSLSHDRQLARARRSDKGSAMG
jgi:hypothetical protein